MCAYVWLLALPAYIRGSRSMKQHDVCPSASLSVPASAHSSKPALLQVALLWATASRRYRLVAAAAAGECGQCHAVSVRRLSLKTDLFCVDVAESADNSSSISTTAERRHQPASQLLHSTKCLELRPSLWEEQLLGPDLQNILRQSYDYLTIMPTLRSSYDHTDV